MQHQRDTHYVHIAVPGAVRKVVSSGRAHVEVRVYQPHALVEAGLLVALACAANTPLLAHLAGVGRDGAMASLCNGIPAKGQGEVREYTAGEGGRQGGRGTHLDFWMPRSSRGGSWRFSGGRRRRRGCDSRLANSGNASSGSCLATRHHTTSHPIQATQYHINVSHNAEATHRRCQLRWQRFEPVANHPVPVRRGRK